MSEYAAPPSVCAITTTTTMYNYDDRITFHTLMLEMSEVTEQKAASPLLESATRFYPCDATLAPYQLLPGVCMSVCLSSRVGVLSKWLNGWRFLRHCVLTYRKIRVPLKIRALPSETLFQTLDLESFATARRLPQGVVNLVRRRWTLSVISGRPSSVELRLKRCLRIS